MKQILIAIIFLFTSCKLFGEGVVWHEGSIVLETREVLVGEISVEIQHDLVLFRKNGKVNVFTVHKIQLVHFYDKQANVNRKYVSQSESNSIFRFRHLYEIVLKGEVSILRRVKPLIAYPKSDADDFVYFVKLNDEMIDLKSFRTKVYPEIIKNGGSLLSMFMWDNHLNPNKANHAIQIIAYYNRLIGGDQALARF